jgi:hypothetical protein
MIGFPALTMRISRRAALGVSGAAGMPSRPSKAEPVTQIEFAKGPFQAAGDSFNA